MTIHCRGVEQSTRVMGIRGRVRTGEANDRSFALIASARLRSRCHLLRIRTAGRKRPTDTDDVRLDD